MDTVEKAKQLSQRLNEAYLKGYNEEDNPYFGWKPGGFGITNSVLYHYYSRGRQDKMEGK